MLSRPGKSGIHFVDCRINPGADLIHRTPAGIHQRRDPLFCIVPHLAKIPQLFVVFGREILNPSLILGPEIGYGLIGLGLQSLYFGGNLIDLLFGGFCMLPGSRHILHHRHADHMSLAYRARSFPCIQYGFRSIG